MDEYCPIAARHWCSAVMKLRSALPVSRLEDGRGRQRHRDGVRARCQRDGAGSNTRLPVQEWGFVWAISARARRCRSSSAQLGAGGGRPRDYRQVILPCNWANPRRRHRLGAQLEPALVRTWCPPVSTAPTVTDSLWLRPSTDKAPRLQVGTGYGFRYAAIRAAHRQRERERLCSADGVRGASDH